jgi:NAD(P)-dependent dehydrogenase (short-subunit alcohol dehydrogenase family)
LIPHNYSKSPSINSQVLIDKDEKIAIRKNLGIGCESMGKLEAKKAVITGGAYGIGEATVRLFVKEGAQVLIADLQEEKGKQLAKELGENVDFKFTDVREESHVKSMIDYAIEKYGQLDCLFNNAGIGGVGGPIESIPVDRFDDVIAVNIRGVFLGMKYAAPIMKRQRKGSIINTGSIAGMRGFNTNHPYSASKAAVIQLTRAIAMELGEFGVRVNCVCPGIMVTSIFGLGFDLTRDNTEKTLDKLKPVFKKKQPLPRAGLPEDVAQAVLWLASDDSSFVTGHSLVIDGGVIAGQKWSDRLSFLDEVRTALDVDALSDEKEIE